MQSRPGQNENLEERSLTKGREPIKGGRGTMLPPPDAESTLPQRENLEERELNRAPEPRKGGRGTMLPPPDAESTLPEKENLQEKDLNRAPEPKKGGRGTMLPPPDAESTLPGVDDVPIAEGGVISGGPYDRLSGTGLTSQSFGTDDIYDHHKHKYHELALGGENQEEDEGSYNYSGSDFRRLPSYEIQNTHQDNVSGLRKASFNLEQRNSSQGFEKLDEDDDDDFTTGLMRGDAPKDDSYKHVIAPKDQNILKRAATEGSEKHKKYQAQQSVDKENVGTTYLL